MDFVSVVDGIDTTTPVGRFFFRTMASIAELERDIIVERTQAGQKAARARGRVGGRPCTPKKDVGRALKLYDSNEYSVP
ncbi:recombinase family protein [Cytobacillus firmus]|uniref:recombinase family protein n=1 Tax=Cytobacillus firmus TaxID=1399 RepID=UPI003D6465C4